ncbi:MAG: thermonuclease family protein, partial [Pseudomonadota bacterium]
MLTLFLVVAMAAAYLSRLSTEEFAGGAQVLDGDSLRIVGVEVRLKGIDAPEFGQICTDAAGQTYNCGERAKQKLRQLIAGNAVRCESSQRDRYGRALAVCHASDEMISLNEHMVRSGWAVDFGGYGRVEQVARRESAGLWAGAFDLPSDFR